MSRARVLWLAKGLGRGGAERLLSLSVAHIDRGRFDVEVAYLLPHKNALVPEIEAQGIPVHCLGSSRSTDLAWARRLRALVHDRRYDLVHTHSPYPATAARLGLAPHRPVIVHTEHNVWARYRLGTRVANSLTYARNDAVIAVSRGVADSIVAPRWFGRRRMPSVEVLHHGIDVARVCTGPDARAAARDALGIEAATRVVGTVANFTPKKDQATLLRALRELVAAFPDVLLLLVGTGPLEPQLRAQAARDGIADHVVFLGSRDDVQQILPAFDVFALSSLHEGLSIALLEAMAAGIPCVSTKVGGVPEAMTDGHEGFLVPARDTHALATALAKLLGDAELRAQMGQRGRRNAARFSVGTAVRRMESTYERALAAR